ncbi:hypothetical protein E2N92_12265 [Methanofollis formosanus]|uniref:Uncharacterized protein n=1 Tax=Methanofollis formosanus TaxID=299308 RepID=A0A8G1EHE7_9EURY|nr:hypothetical protein [Methanofollis formosanus]QYZ80146.1 hypothetical protein E2N92_12265 [Methanofollis formosanus]
MKSDPYPMPGEFGRTSTAQAPDESLAEWAERGGPHLRKILEGALCSSSVPKTPAPTPADDKTIPKYPKRTGGPPSRRSLLARLRDYDEWPEDEGYDDDDGEGYDETVGSMGYGSFWYENYDEIYDSMASR